LRTALEELFKGRQVVDQVEGFETDRNNLTKEADDILGVVSAVGVAGDAAPFVGADFVLVDEPFQGGAVAEFVVKDAGRDAGQGEKVVVDDGGFTGESFIFSTRQLRGYPGVSSFSRGYSGWDS
jgi:hypothetical protein